MGHPVKKIGFLGGTFDPIHFGHLNVAIHMKEHFLLDEVLFAPTFCNPFKVTTPPLADIIHRTNMVSLAIDQEPSFGLSMIDAEGNGVTYTVDSLQKLQKAYPDAKLFLLISGGIIRDFPQWKNPEKICQIAQVLVGKDELGQEIEIDCQYIFSQNVISIPKFSISSTCIRQRIKEKLFCGHLLPDKVLRYIEQHNLYLS